MNAPVLNSDNKEEYVAFVNQIVHAFLTDRNENPELHELIKFYKLHRYSKTCRKYKNEVFIFKFCKFFTKETLIAEPLPESKPEEMKVFVLHKRNEILQKVKDYINDFLNSPKVNFFDPSRNDFTEVKSIPEVLIERDVNVEEYENALRISYDKGFQLHLRRPTDSCFVNNYFDIGLFAWEANIDIQTVFGYYNTITYMCCYLSKQEDECS